MGALMNLSSVFLGYHLVDGRTAFLLATLCGSHSAGPKLESSHHFKAGGFRQGEVTHACNPSTLGG